MKGKLIIDGNAVYEIDEECMRQMEINKNQNETRNNEKDEWKTAAGEKHTRSSFCAAKRILAAAIISAAAETESAAAAAAK